MFFVVITDVKVEAEAAEAAEAEGAILLADLTACSLARSFLHATLGLAHPNHKKDKQRIFHLKLKLTHCARLRLSFRIFAFFNGS